MDLKEQRILVTGGAGFVGAHVVRTLRSRGCERIFVPRSREYDLCEKQTIVQLLAATHPTIVIHLAAVVGGIGANCASPGRFFFRNLVMGAHLMEEARLFGVLKFVGLGTVCCYPKFAPVPFREEDLWRGYPEETTAPYGLAKKMLLVQAQVYRQEYGFDAVTLLPTNLYGPGDNFDPRTSHVVPALIKKCCDARDAGATEVVVWSDGTPTREFLYVGDAAEAIVLATERYSKPEPVNVGSGQETSIRELAELIVAKTGFDGRIAWDPTQPGGQPRRVLDTSRAWQEFGFRATVGLEEGLERTIAWYEAQRARARPAHE